MCVTPSCLLFGMIRIAAMDAQLNQVAAWLVKGQKGFERIVIVGMVGMGHPLGSISFKYREIGILVQGFCFEDVPLKFQHPRHVPNYEVDCQASQ